jgi:hypothetical protein
MSKHIGELHLRDEKSLGRVEKFIEEVCDYYNIGDEYFANVMLGTSEAVRLMLGKRKSLTDNIVIEAVKSTKGLKFVIRQDHKKKDTTEETDELELAIEQDHLTRQLFIIKSLSDEIKVHKRGLRLEITYYVTTLNAEKSIYRINQLKEYFRNTELVTNKKDA